MSLCWGENYFPQGCILLPDIYTHTHTYTYTQTHLYTRFRPFQTSSNEDETFSLSPEVILLLIEYACVFFKLLTESQPKLYGKERGYQRPRNNSLRRLLRKGKFQDTMGDFSLCKRRPALEPLKGAVLFTFHAHLQLSSCSISSEGHCLVRVLAPAGEKHPHRVHRWSGDIGVTVHDTTELHPNREQKHKTTDMI